ncbi:MAG TPA: GYD domain-containing protein [Gemmataceae bacterium]|nr:GYD domain-containing protein [Gemmataceae bacterium]
MATFITTVRFTEQGLKNIRDTRKRSEAFQAAAQKRGAKVKDVYWALGAFDGVLIFDAPDDETAAGLMLELAALGNVQTQTARAFTAAEMEKILSVQGK